MFLELTNFYPFNVRSGFEFLFLYAVLGLIGITLLTLVRRVYGAHLDGQTAGATPNDKRLAIGNVPSPEQYYAIAYLRNASAGVADTLIAVAHAAGALRVKPDAEKTFLVSLEPGTPDHPILRAFIERMLPQSPSGSLPVEVSATEVRNAAGTTATEYREVLRKELTASGLLRVPEVQSRVVTALWLGGLLIVAFGGIRLARALLFGHRFLFLAIEMVCFVFMTYYVTRASKTADSALKESYLDWLKDSTTSLRVNVSSGWSTTQESVGLGVALEGAGILGTAAIAGGLVYAFMPHYGMQPVSVQQTHVHTSNSGYDGGVDISGSYDTSSFSTSTTYSGGSSSCSSGSSGSDSGSSGGDSGGSSGCGGGGGGCGGGGGGCGGGGGGCGGGG
jgi:uncharacterized protein (TIGR04222 family)